MRYGYDQGDSRMRKISSVITAVFIILAAALGWFLPIVDFDAYDKFSEGMQKDLEIICFCASAPFFQKAWR